MTNINVKSVKRAYHCCLTCYYMWQNITVIHQLKKKVLDDKDEVNFIKNQVANSDKEEAEAMLDKDIF